MAVEWITTRHLRLMINRRRRASARSSAERWAVNNNNNRKMVARHSLVAVPQLRLPRRQRDAQADVVVVVRICSALSRKRAASKT